jgi:hypothetical protein
VDRAPDAASEEQAALVFSKLVELDPENPVRFRYAPDAIRPLNSGVNRQTENGSGGLL